MAYFQRKIQLSGFSAYPDGLLSPLIRVSGVILAGDKIEKIEMDGTCCMCGGRERCARNFGGET